MTPAQIKSIFEIAIQANVLTGNVSYWMFMGVDDLGTAYFKHSDTRQSVSHTLNVGQLIKLGL